MRLKSYNTAGISISQGTLHGSCPVGFISLCVCVYVCVCGGGVNVRAEYMVYLIKCSN